jgi:prepilin-type N-terminal cleavage/methylation domain-containing protein
MRRRGLTMVEMLMALLLLSAIVMANASWTSIAGRLGAHADWAAQAVIEQVFARIHDDLVTGDFGPPHPHSHSREKDRFRVRVQDGTLEIDTRAGHTSIYRFDPLAHVLERVTRGGQALPPRRLMGDIDSFACSIDDEKRPLVVTLEVRTPAAASYTRRFALP